MISASCTTVKLLAGLTALAVLACLCGCSSDSLVDERNIYYIRGMKLRDGKKPEEAVKAFETCLRLSPQSAQAHLQLALIYDETLDDPLTAVYHFRRFLEMRSGDASVEVVKGWLQKAEQKLIQRLQQAAVYAALNQEGMPPVLPDSAGPSARELALLARVQELTASNEELRERADEPIIDPTLLPPLPSSTAPALAPPAPTMSATPVPLPAVAESAPAAPAVAVPRPTPKPAPTPVAAPAAAARAATAPAAGVRYHTVVGGDTLINLSRRYYGTTSHWPQLRQANRDLLGERTDLKLGVKLRIPPVAQLPPVAAAAPRKSR